MVNFNPIDKDYIVRWQSDLKNTKERPLHKPSQDQSKSTALGGVWNFAERCITPWRYTVWGDYRDNGTWPCCQSCHFHNRLMKLTPTCWSTTAVIDLYICIKFLCIVVFKVSYEQTLITYWATIIYTHS